MKVTLRPERESEPDGDGRFLRQLVIETAARELGAEFWPESVRGPLLDVQYTARRNSIRENFPGGRSEVIQIDGEDAGWLFVAETEHELRIVEIMIAKAWRGRGAGTTVLRRVLIDAGSKNKPVRLHVRSGNAGALRLYQRLGFRLSGGDGTTLLLEHSHRVT